MQITLPHKPRGNQIALYNLKARFTVGVIGRQYGKGTIGKLRSVTRSMPTQGGMYWWVSPTFPQAKVEFKRLIKHYRPAIVRVNKTDSEIEFIGGSILQFKGSDDYENLKGETLNGCTLDECGKMKADVWPEVIRPMLATTGGWADFWGTPKGKNWFYHIAERAKSGDDNYAYHHATSLDSPFFSQSEFDEARTTTPERIFRQEYLAEFLDDDSEVFRGIRACISGELQDPVPGHHYQMGVDLAKTFDWTVITVVDIETKQVVSFERFNRIDWELQLKRISATANKYRAAIKIDSTGVGDPIYERLRRAGASVTPVRFTNQIKAHLIENLSIMIEQRELTYPDLPELINELNIFQSEKTPSGNIRYNSPSGFHDDCVISLGLAVDGLARARHGQATL